MSKYGDDFQVKAGTPVMQLVAADWFKSDRSEEHLAARAGCVIQKLFVKQVCLLLVHIFCLTCPSQISFNIASTCKNLWNQELNSIEMTYMISFSRR